MEGDYVRAQAALQSKYEQGVVRVKERFVGLINKANVVKSRVEEFRGRMEEYLSFIGIGIGIGTGTGIDTGSARQSPTKTTTSPSPITSRDGELSKQICASIFVELSKF